MMPVVASDLALGIAAACGASVLYDLSIALQALEVREVPRDHSMRPALLVRLFRNPRWVLATAVGVLGWPLQVLALTLAPLTVVQPCLALGLFLLLGLGVRVLHERVGALEIGAVLAITVGVVGISLSAPEHTTAHGSASALAIGLGGLALLTAVPFVLPSLRSGSSVWVVVAAGSGYALSGLTSKLIADGLSAGDVAAILGWSAATALAAVVGLLSEMSAIQHRQVTSVAPIVFVVQVAGPVLLAPVLGGESWASTPGGGLAIVVSLAVVVAGAFALTRSPAVAGLIAAAEEYAHGDGVQPAGSQLGRE